MRWLMLLSVVGCNDPGFDGVSIRPTYGWVDGCTDVVIGGHGFDNQVSATLGGKPVTGIGLPDPETQELEVGFEFYALTPPGEVGFVDMVVTNGDGEQADTVENAFYYVACPGAPHIDGISATDVAAGTSVTITGCGFSEGLTAEFIVPSDPTGTTPTGTQTPPTGTQTPPPTGTQPPAVAASAPLTLTCSTAQASFDAPALEPGTYFVQIVDASGTVVYGSNPCDTADTGGGCESPLLLTYGGGT